MRIQTVESAVAAMMALIMTASGAAPAIGTVVAKGAFRIDSATVTGNATLFEGVTIETKAASSRMELSSGAKVALGADSKAKFYGDHMVLEKGESRLEKAQSFNFVALGLTIQPETGNASGRVAIGTGANVEVAAITGSFRVLNARGLLVANVRTGKFLTLEPQPTVTVTKLTGILRQASGHFLITDETTNVTVELMGPGLAKEVGNRVAITGTMDSTAVPVTDASQLVQVTTLTHLGSGVGAAPAGKGGGPPKIAVGGLKVSVTTIAIIGGVAVAATLGGLAAAGKLPGQGSSSISR